MTALIPYPDVELDFRFVPSTESVLHLHHQAEPLDLPTWGPYVQNHSAELVYAEGQHAYVSSDEGKNWQTFSLDLPEHITVSESRSLICLDSGILLLSFVNVGEMHFNWRKSANKPTRNTRLPHYIMRSLDGGKSWQAPIILQSGYAAATTTLIQRRDGTVVVSAQNLDYDQGRHYTLSFVSKDEGQTWQSSNRLDIGGQGHHDGCYEGSLVELKDGRLLYFIRTNLDWFWQAWSEDGLTWLEMSPGPEASSSPPMLKRLASGRICLLFNPLQDSQKNEIKRRAGRFSKRPASWVRNELYICFSEDEGRSWSSPVVLASCDGSWLSYPSVCEISDGQLWITTMQSQLKLCVKEQDLIGL